MWLEGCFPFTHKWTVRKVSVPLFDIGAKGELWRCTKCGKVKAK